MFTPATYAFLSLTPILPLHFIPHIHQKGKDSIHQVSLLAHGWFPINVVCMRKGIIPFELMQIDLQYPIVTFSPSVSTHSAHLLLYQTQPLNYFLTNNPQVL